MRMMIRAIAASLALLFGWALGSSPALGQDTVTGAFQGSVTNSLTGDPIEGATAEIINVETGTSFTKRTDARGVFYQGLLAPGVYRIKVSKPGYQPREVEQRLRISFPGEVVPVPVSLDPAPIGTPTTPSPPTPTTPAPSPAPAAAPAAADTEVRASINRLDAHRGGSFSEVELNALPLGGATLTRSFDELALLLPGVAPPPQTLGSVAGPGQGAGVGTSGQFAVNGLRSRANNFTVDGSDNNDEDIGVRRQGFLALIPQTIESVKEYQAITLLAPAQFGRNLGAQVNAVSRSGGNQVHGTVYGFFNASHLNARNPFDTTDGNAVTPVLSATGQRVLLDGQPLTVRNQSGGKDSFTLGKVGAVLGGPLGGNKTFYFFSFEGQQINATQEESFAVPTVEQRGAFGSGASGIFQNPFDNGPNGTPLTARARPVSGNASQIFSLFPFPNHPRGVYGANTFTQVLPASARGVVSSLKLDHNFDWRKRPQSVVGRYNFTDDWRQIPATGGALFSTLKPLVRTQNFSFFFNSQLSATGARRDVFNQVRYSFGRTRLRFDEVRDTDFLLPNRNFADVSFLLNAALIVNNTLPPVGGVPNTGDVIYTTQRINGAAVGTEIGGPLGQINMAGFSPVGVDVYNFPQRRVNNTYQLADTLTWRAGNHSLAFGEDIRRSALDSDLPRVSRPLVTFNGGPRIVNDAQGNERIATAADRTPFLRAEDLAALDAANAFFLTVSTEGKDARIELRFYQYNFFAQDDWRLRPNLTLGLGLRYEYNTPPAERHNRIENTFNAPALALVPGLRRFVDGRTRIFEPDRNNWGPRLSLAYAPRLFGAERVTVLRAGYGIFYDQILGAVVSQSRNVFPTFFTLNFAGARASRDPAPLILTNPVQSVLQGVAPLVAACPTPPCALNQLNSLYDFNQLLSTLSTTFPDALGVTLPTRRLAMPSAQHYSAAIEQQLSAGLTVSAAYVGTQGRNLLRFTTPNQGAGATIATRAFGSGVVPRINGRIVTPTRPVVGVGTVNLFETNANSRYDALQLQLHARRHSALQYQASYTFSRVTDDVSDVFDLAGASALPQDSLNLRAERGPANFDAHHRFTSFLIYDLSELAAERKGSLGWLLGGLQLAGTVRVSSGQPFTVNSLFDINRDGNLTDRLDNLTGLTTTGDGSQPLRLTTQSLFGLLATVGQDGRIGRNTFRAGGLAEVDLALSKQFRFHGQQINLRAEGFNLFNHANFAIPVRLLEAPGFGVATRTATPARRIQFVLKYEF